MENVVVQQVVSSCVHRTLHAHHFSRTSSQASLVLSDLLSRYMALLAGTCARYAEHAGRTNINAHDAVKALGELGVHMDELLEYGSTEGRETNRYAVQTQRRLDELLELKNFLRDGLRQDRSDARTIKYKPMPADMVNGDAPSPVSLGKRSRSESEDDEDEADEEPYEDDEPELPEKRARLSAWSSDPPDDIPAHLPALPRPKEPTPPPEEVAPAPAPAPAPAKAPTPGPAGPSRKSTPAPAPQPEATPALALASAGSSADYRSSIPYDHSTLASLPEWHLPPSPPASPKPASKTTGASHLPLLTAYHYLLSDVSAEAAVHPPSTPARHKLAMALLAGDPISAPATVFGVAGPGQRERLAAQLPSFAKSLVTPGGRVTHPPTATRPAIPGMGVGVGAPLLSALAARNVSSAIMERVSRVAPPPVQLRSNGQPILYGAPVPAPWNPPSDPALQDKDSKEPVLTPAELWATWPVETRDFEAPLPARKKKEPMAPAPPSRAGSVHS
ncbi:hypothetical protein AURDEDRAFT_117146 [Auricularia subglabra TFB-10046 SS5]|nr:hypothetical protein AURDEDRAFT_117146 [Auricularia subglabra TFB-10046 SS5]